MGLLGLAYLRALFAQALAPSVSQGTIGPVTLTPPYHSHERLAMTTQEQPDHIGSMSHHQLNDALMPIHAAYLRDCLDIAESLDIEFGLMNSAWCHTPKRVALVPIISKANPCLADAQFPSVIARRYMRADVQAIVEAINRQRGKSPS